MLIIRPEQLEVFLPRSSGDDEGLIVPVPASPVAAQELFVVRDEQLKALSEAQFNGRVQRVLKEVFPDGTFDGDPQFESTLHKVLTKAKQYRIGDDADLARYVCLAYLFGADFDTEFSAAQSILMDDSRPADERLELLEFWAEMMLEASSVGA